MHHHHASSSSSLFVVKHAFLTTFKWVSKQVIVVMQQQLQQQRHLHQPLKTCLGHQRLFFKTTKAIIKCITSSVLSSTYVKWSQTRHDNVHDSLTKSLNMHDMLVKVICPVMQLPSSLEYLTFLSLAVIAWNCFHSFLMLFFHWLALSAYSCQDHREISHLIHFLYWHRLFPSTGNKVIAWQLNQINNFLYDDASSSSVGNHHHQRWTGVHKSVIVPSRSLYAT